MADDKVTLAFTRRDVARVLGTLRYAARCFERDKVCVDELSDGGFFEGADGPPPTHEDLDALAERINCGDCDYHAPASAGWVVKLPMLDIPACTLPTAVVADKPYPAIYWLRDGVWAQSHGHPRAGVIIPAPSLAAWANDCRAFKDLFGMLCHSTSYMLSYFDFSGIPSPIDTWKLSEFGTSNHVRLTLGTPPAWALYAGACALVPAANKPFWADVHECHPSVL